MKGTRGEGARAGERGGAAAAQLRRPIMRLVHESTELAEHDAALPMHERQGVAGVLAMRPMHFSGFSRYRRGPAAGR